MSEGGLALATASDAAKALRLAWPLIVDECRAVLGGELHYQAVVYHCLRLAGVPRRQIGMNVKQWIPSPVTPLFKAMDLRKHESFRGGFEPIPDVVLFRPEVERDWRRRNHARTLGTVAMAIEIKASERANGRLGHGEIVRDIDKLDAQLTETGRPRDALCGVMLVVDVAPLPQERMRAASVAACRDHALARGIGWLHVSLDEEAFIIPS